MPVPVARAHALSLGRATTLRARRACTHTYIMSRSQTYRLGALDALRILTVSSILHTRLTAGARSREARSVRQGRAWSANPGNKSRIGNRPLTSTPLPPVSGPLDCRSAAPRKRRQRASSLSLFLWVTLWEKELCVCVCVWNSYMYTVV